MILAIETATPVCSVSYMDSKAKIAEKRETGKGIHSEKLFLFIEELKKKHNFQIEDLDEILISRGPGSYTGLRIGAAAAKGLLFGSNTSLITLGTLESVIAGVLDIHPASEKVHAVLDARRQHLYHLEMKNGDQGMELGIPAIKPVEEVDAMLNDGDVVAGTGLERLSKFEKEGIRFIGESCISATNLITARKRNVFSERFERIDPEEFEPDYLSMSQINDTRIV